MSHTEYIQCDFLDLRHFVEVAFNTGKTPLVLDSSIDEKVCTYYSYQTDAIILEARSMIMQSSNSLKDALEIGRRALSNAMRHGKTLVIRMGTSAPDFRSTLNDSNLATAMGKPLDESYFPEQVFVEAGRLLHDSNPREDGTEWAQKIIRAEDMFPHRNIAFCREGFRIMLVSQIPIHEIDELLFGNEWGGLPSKDLFALLQVHHDTEDSESDASS